MIRWSQAALEQGTMSGTFRMHAEGPDAADAAEQSSGGQITMKFSWRPAVTP